MCDWNTNRIYMDNAATSFPKPPQVLEAMNYYATWLGASPGRGAYAEAREAGQLMQVCRQRIAALINADLDKPQQVIFTLNTSDALNLAIRGIVFGPWANPPRPQSTKPPSTSPQPVHLITTHLDHNSILRPFNTLCARYEHITQTRIACDPQTGRVDPRAIEHAIEPHTKLIGVVHGSNVTGTVQPIGEIGQIAQHHDIPLLVDAAQTAGHWPIDMQRQGVDLLAAPGHKGMLGPLGTGFLYIRPGIEQRMASVREGGTGSISEQDVQPEFLPDRFEPGSHNAIGLIGLGEALRWILDRGVNSLWQHQHKLTRQFLEQARDIEGLRIFGPTLDQMNDQPGLTANDHDLGVERCGVFSVRMEGYDQPLPLSQRLEEDFGILTRSGIHCAPLAHKTIGTHHLEGTTRLSFGPFTTEDHVHHATHALAQLAEPLSV